MEKKLAEWFASNDTGTSSKAIALFLSAGISTGSVPSDSADFGRCYRLLKHMGWESRIAEMAEASGRWAVLVEIWPQLTEAFEKQDYEAVYSLINGVEVAGYKRDGYTVQVDESGGMRFASKGNAATFSMSFGK
jgi:hypothetical protein